MVGFPHSEIPGSKLIRSSPRLIAAYYVLHRLHAPRHPLDALKALDRSHYRCPLPVRRSCINRHLVHRLERSSTPHGVACFDRSDQINQNSRAVAVSLRGTDQTSSEASLYDVERSGRFASGDAGAAKLALYCATIFYGRNWWSRSGSNRRPEACKATALPTELRPHSICRWWALARAARSRCNRRGRAKRVPLLGTATNEVSGGPG